MVNVSIDHRCTGIVDKPVIRTVQQGLALNGRRLQPRQKRLLEQVPGEIVFHRCSREKKSTQSLMR